MKTVARCNACRLQVALQHFQVARGASHSTGNLKFYMFHLDLFCQLNGNNTEIMWRKPFIYLSPAFRLRYNVSRMHSLSSLATLCQRNKSIGIFTYSYGLINRYEHTTATACRVRSLCAAVALFGHYSQIRVEEAGAYSFLWNNSAFNRYLEERVPSTPLQPCALAIVAAIHNLRIGS